MYEPVVTTEAEDARLIAWLESRVLSAGRYYPLLYNCINFCSDALSSNVVGFPSGSAVQTGWLDFGAEIGAFNSSRVITETATVETTEIVGGVERTTTETRKYLTKVGVLPDRLAFYGIGGLVQYLQSKGYTVYVNGLRQ